MKNQQREAGELRRFGGRGLNAKTGEIRFELPYKIKAEGDSITCTLSFGR